VGVAITTAVYSIVDAVFLRGLGIHEPDRVAVLVTPYSGRLLTGTVSEPDFRDVQTAQTSFSHVAASATFVRRLALPSVTEMVIGVAVGLQLASTLGTGSRLKQSPRTAAPRATARDDRRLTVVGRLATEVTIAAASAEMQTIAERLDEVFPPRFRGKGVGATDRPW